MIQRDLIFDIGAFDGTDTQIYLEQGYQVVAVEACPDNFSKLMKRFHSNRNTDLIWAAVVGASDESRTVEFFSSWSQSWSCLAPWVREETELKGVLKRSVPSITLEELFSKYGVPYYLKIDIEGAEEWVLESLLLMDPDHLPPYLSFEITHGTDAIFNITDTFGYDFACMVEQSQYSTPEQRHRSGPWGNQIQDWTPYAEFSHNFQIIREKGKWHDVHLKKSKLVEDEDVDA